MVDFEWDEDKRKLVIEQHGVDLVKASRIFENWVLTTIDGRKDYNEIRKISIGLVSKDCYVVVFTERNCRVRLITAWKGGQDERRQYQAGLARRNPSDG